jgi:putative oxidoreductase
MQAIFALGRSAIALLDKLHAWLSPLLLRVLLAYEYWESGYTKYKSDNWFADIQDAFPFPFNLIPADLNWQLATYFELIGAIALLVGLGTRFFSLSLIVVTVVAWAAVHAGNGYNVCDNGWKLPLFYLVLFLPLLLGGGGKLSLDHLIFGRKKAERA